MLLNQGNIIMQGITRLVRLSWLRAATLAALIVFYGKSSLTLRWLESNLKFTNKLLAIVTGGEEWVKQTQKNCI